MLINKIYEISSCDDVELKIKRKSKLEYRISFDDEKEMKAIVFIVGGFGANANISFLDFDREYLAKNFDVVVVDVFYHCFCARKSIDEAYNPKIVPNDEDLKRVDSVLNDLGFSYLKTDEENFLEAIVFIDKEIEKLKNAKQINPLLKAEFNCDLIPPNGDYQNYGIMAAIDHINVLKDIMKKFPHFKNLPKIYGGGVIRGLSFLAFSKNCSLVCGWSD